MAVSPPNNQKGFAKIVLTSLGSTRTFTVTSNVTWPSNYVETSSFTITVADSFTGATPPGANVIVAIVEDAVEVSGNYVTALGGSTLSTGVLAILDLGNNPAAGTYTVGNGLNGAGASDSRNAALSKFGTFRIVVSCGSNLNAALRVGDGGGTNTFHHDSDVNDASGTGNTVTAGTQITGTGGVKCKLTAQSRAAGNWGYGTGTITESLTFKSAIDGTSAPYTNASLKNMKVGWSKVVDPGSSDIVKKQNIALSSAGVISVPATNIDTDWGTTSGGDSYYSEVAVGQNFGDGTTPSGEKAAIYAIGTTDAADNEQMAYVFANVTQASPFVNSSGTNRRLRTNTADQLASAQLKVFKNSGLSTVGIGVYSSSGRTTVQDIFMRGGPTRTENAVPFLEVFVADAYGVAINAKSVKVNVLRDFDSGQENTQTITTASTGKVDWNYTIGSTHTAFNRFVEAGATRATGSDLATGPDNPDSPPITFSNAAKTTDDYAGTYPYPTDQTHARGSYDGPYPAYGKDVQVMGNAFSGTKEPSVTTTNVFGVNSEVILEGVFTATVAQAIVDLDLAPSGLSTRTQTLGAGSLRFKASSEISGTTNKLMGRASGTATSGSTTTIVDTAKNFVNLGVKIGDVVKATSGAGNGQSAIVTSVTTTTNANDTLNFAAVGTAFNNTTVYLVDENNPKDIAGRTIDATVDPLNGRFAVWNQTATQQQIAPTNMASNHGLSTALGYGAQNGSPYGFETLAAPTDPGNMSIYCAHSDGVTQATTFDLQSSAPETAGFTSDAFNFGYFRQVITFIAADPTLLIQVIADQTEVVAGSDVRITAQFNRIQPDGTLSPIFADAPPNGPRIYIAKDQGAGVPLSNLINAAMTSISPQGDGTSSDWTYTWSAPANGSYSAIVSGTASASRPAAGNIIIFVGSPDSLAVIVGGGNLSNTAKHFVPGDPFTVGLTLIKNGVAQALDATTMQAALLRLNPASQMVESLQSNNTWSTATPYNFFTLTASTGDPNVYLKTFSSGTGFDTSGWGTIDLFVNGKAKINGVQYRSVAQIDVTGTKNQHDAYVYDPSLSNHGA